MTETIIKQVEVPIITATMTKYQCPMCDKLYGKEEDAKKCSERGTDDKHRCQPGDVILVGYFPGDSYEEDYFIVKRLMWKKSNWYSSPISVSPTSHDDIAVYECEGQYGTRTFQSTEIKKFVMTSCQRERILAKAEDLASKYKDSTVTWSQDDGTYLITILASENMEVEIDDDDDDEWEE